MYNAVIIPITKTAPTINEGCGLNMPLSISKPFGLLPFLFSKRLMMTMPSTAMANTKPIRSINGISYTALPLAWVTSFENPYGLKNARLTKLGNTLKNTDKQIKT